MLERLDLPATASAAGTGRTFVAAFCARHDLAPRVTEDAVLLTSELLSNAYLHARSPAVLSLEVLGPALRVEVADRSDGQPAPSRPDSASPGGRGLLLLDALARSWGVLPRSPGKAVWFELLTES